MKKTKIIALMVLASLGVSTIAYAADSDTKLNDKDKLSAEGYWVQFDEDEDQGRGMPNGIIHTYFAENDNYGKKGTLQMQIVVPLMDVNAAGEPAKPKPICNDCSDGTYNGFSYKGKNADLQGLVFAGNMQKEDGSGNPPAQGPIYKDGGVLNPNDGKIYASEAQVRDGGDTMYAKAAYIVWGKELGGKVAHWKRITKDDYEKVKKDCGTTPAGAYINGDEKITATCTNYNVSQFGIKSPV